MLTEQLKQTIIEDVKEIIKYADWHCNCNHSGTFYEPPEQCDACWNEVELNQLKEFKEDSHERLHDIDIWFGKPPLGSPDCVRNWYEQWKEDSSGMNIDELSSNILFVYYVTDILGELI